MIIKKRLDIVVVLFALLSSIAVGYSQSNSSKNYAIISGKVSNFDNDTLNLLDVADDNFWQTIKVKPDGSFSKTIKADTRMLAILDNKMHYIPIYLNNYNDLHISYDISQENPVINYKGKYANECNYLLKYGENTFLSSDDYSLLMEQYKFEEKEFVKKNREQIDKLISHAKNANLSPDFLKRELRYLEYKYYFNFITYPIIHGDYINNENFTSSYKFPSISDDPNFDVSNAEDFKLSRAYQSLVGIYYQEKILDQKNNSSSSVNNISEDEDIKMLQGIPKYVKNEYIKNRMINKIIIDNFDYTENIDALYKAFMSASTDDELRKIITDKYNIIKKLGAGAPSPKFVNYKNIKGGTVSLDDLKGKYVLIDVWATWCGPCKYEIPYMQKLEEKYHDKNIVFVSISVDEKPNYKKWEKMVTDRNMAGLHLFADKAFKSDFVKSYGINGIPRFILIDTKGNIIDYDAPRPSQPELDNLLSELLK